MPNAISELKLLINELDEQLHKEYVKVIKATNKIGQLEGRVWAVKETLRLWGVLEGQKTLEEAMLKAQEDRLPVDPPVTQG
jgi:hypothetical protein